MYFRLWKAGFFWVYAPGTQELFLKPCCDARLLTIPEARGTYTAYFFSAQYKEILIKSCFDIQESADCLNCTFLWPVQNTASH